MTQLPITAGQARLLESLRTELGHGNKVSVDLGTVERIFEDATGEPFSIGWARRFVARWRGLRDAVDNAVSRAVVGEDAALVPRALWDALVEAMKAVPRG